MKPIHVGSEGARLMPWKSERQGLLSLRTESRDDSIDQGGLAHLVRAFKDNESSGGNHGKTKASPSVRYLSCRERNISLVIPSPSTTLAEKHVMRCSLRPMACATK